MILTIKIAKCIRKNAVCGLTLGLFILSLASACRGEVDGLQMDFASRLTVSTNIEIVNKISKKSLRKLPASLPVYRYSGKPQSFLTNGIQALLDESAFSETNVDSFFAATNFNSLANALFLKNAKRPPDTFSVNPLRGDIHLENAERKTTIPQSEAVPKQNEIADRLFAFVKMLGIQTNEMEMSNGIVKISGGDAETSAWSGEGMRRTHFVNERRVTIQRGIKGYSTWLFDDKISLSYGVDDNLLKFSLHWPKIEAVRTNQLLNVSEMIQKINQDQALTDVTDISEQDIRRIILTDIEIQYYTKQSRNFGRMGGGNSDIFPVAAISASFQTKSGQTENAGIYLPIIN